jgi:beta-lactamase regulating signal transducer with metallopeptidase domain
MSELSVLVRSTAILTTGLAVLRASQGASASTRSLCLALTFGALLLFPLASATLPPARIAVPLPAPATLESFQPSSVPHAGTRSNNPRLSTARRAPASISSRQWIGGVWLTGAALAALPLGLAVASGWRMRRRGTAWPRGTEVLRRLVGVDATRRPVAVLRDTAIRTPCTIAFFRPAIVFPLDADTWTDDDIHRVMIHEYEHVTRGDWFILLGARLACSLYWFHPLAWLALRRLRVETERACDDAVVRSSDAPAYAEQLVELASRLSAGARTAVLPMASGTELSARISSILDRGRRRTRTTPGGRWIAFVSTVAMAGVIAATEPVSTSLHAEPGQEPALGEILPLEQANYGKEAQSGGASLSGVLYDPFGQPLAGVVLGIESLQFGNPPVPAGSSPFYRALRTDANGRYSFNRVPPGLYGLASPSSDFFPGDRLLLRSGEQVTGDIHMRIEPTTTRVTACRDCEPGTVAFDLPDSIRRELERDERLALSAPVAAAEPISETLTGEIRAPYPPALHKTSIEGHAVVEGVIAVDGTSQAMRVTASTHTALAAAAIDVLASERWKPAYVRGVAVEAPFRVNVDFVLK